MLVTMKEMLQDAKKNHYAIPAFDISNYEMMKAVLETCEEQKSPALIMALGVDLQGRDMNLLSSMIKPPKTPSRKATSVLQTLHRR